VPWSLSLGVLLGLVFLAFVILQKRIRTVEVVK